MDIRLNYRRHETFIYTDTPTLLTPTCPEVESISNLHHLDTLEMTILEIVILNWAYSRSSSLP